MQSKTVTFPGRVLHLSEDQEQLKAATTRRAS